MSLRFYCVVVAVVFCNSLVVSEDGERGSVGDSIEERTVYERDSGGFVSLLRNSPNPSGALAAILESGSFEYTIEFIEETLLIDGYPWGAGGLRENPWRPLAEMYVGLLKNMHSESNFEVSDFETLEKRLVVVEQLRSGEFTRESFDWIESPRVVEHSGVFEGSELDGLKVEILPKAEYTFDRNDCYFMYNNKYGFESVFKIFHDDTHSPKFRLTDANESYGQFLRVESLEGGKYRLMTNVLEGDWMLGVSRDEYSQNENLSLVTADSFPLPNWEFIEISEGGFSLVIDGGDAELALMAVDIEGSEEKRLILGERNDANENQIWKFVKVPQINPKNGNGGL